MSLNLNAKLKARKKVLLSKSKSNMDESNIDETSETKPIQENNENDLKEKNENPEVIDKIQLIRRYMDLLKTTLIAFFFSTSLHIGIIFGYYWLYLYFNPNDQGKKDFYSQTTTSPGVNIGGKVVGGGGVQTNHHKSYLLHLVREYYKTLSKTFFIEFSLIYVFFLYILSFFPNRAKLKEDTAAAFASYKIATEQNVPKVKKAKSKKILTKKAVLNTRLRQRKNKVVEESIDEERADDIESINEESVDDIESNGISNSESTGSKNEKDE